MKYSGKNRQPTSLWERGMPHRDFFSPHEVPFSVLISGLQLSQGSRENKSPPFLKNSKNIIRTLQMLSGSTIHQILPGAVCLWDGGQTASVFITRLSPRIIFGYPGSGTVSNAGPQFTTISSMQAVVHPPPALVWLVNMYFLSRLLFTECCAQSWKYKQSIRAVLRLH